MSYDPNTYNEYKAPNTKVRRAIGAVAVSAVAVGLFYGGNKLVDRVSGLDAAVARNSAAKNPQLVEPKTVEVDDINPNARYVTFIVEPGKNTLSHAAEKYAPKDDPLEAAAKIDAYRTNDGKTNYNVQYGEHITFAVDPAEGEVVPIEHAPPLPDSAQQP